MSVQLILRIVRIVRFARYSNGGLQITLPDTVRFVVFVAVSNGQFYPCPSGCLHWHWGIRLFQSQWSNPEEYRNIYHKPYIYIHIHIKMRQNKTVCIFMGQYGTWVKRKRPQKPCALVSRGRVLAQTESPLLFLRACRRLVANVSGCCFSIVTGGFYLARKQWQNLGGVIP